MKAEKKASEKDAKLKDQLEQKKESNDQAELIASALDEATLDPTVRFLFFILLFMGNVLIVLY